MKWIAVALAFGGVGCATLGGTEPPESALPETPGPGVRCKVAASHENPLVTEWSSAEKANLEARAASGAVAVEYSGCEMRVMAECPLRGAYVWRRTTTTTDFIQVENEDELYAKLPLGAPSLEGALARTGSLTIQTTVSGQLVLDRFDDKSVERDPRCQSATHVIRGVAIGAFRMRTGDRQSARGGIEVVGVGTTSSTDSLREAGDPQACKQATREEPHPDCRSPVQLFLAPLPKTIARRGPPGTLHARFLPPDTDSDWKLTIADRELCKLPCQRRVDPSLPYSYRAEAGFLRPDHVVELPDLREHSGQGEVDVRFTEPQTSRRVWGILMTTFGGLALVTGAAVMAATCRDSTGGCIAGGATSVGGVGLLVPGIVFIATSGREIEVVPARLPVGENMDGEPVLR